MTARDTAEEIAALKIGDRVTFLTLIVLIIHLFIVLCLLDYDASRKTKALEARVAVLESAQRAGGGP